MIKSKRLEDTPQENKPQEDKPPKKKGRTWLRLIIKLIAVCFVLAGLVIGIVVLMLPHIVSSEWFRQIVVEQGSQFLKRPIHLDTLTWTWSQGIVLESFKIEDDPSLSSKPLVSFNKFSLDTRFRELLNRRAVLDFRLDGLNAHFIRSKEGTTNLDMLLSQLPKSDKKKEEPEKEKKEPFDLSTFSLPLDGQVHIHLTSLAFTMDDRAQEKTLIISSGTVMVDTDSVIDEKTTVHVSADVELDGRELPAFKLEAEAEKVFNSEGKLTINDAVVMTDVDIAGIKLTGRAEPGKKALNSKLVIMLNETMDVARPFLPFPLSETDLKGAVELTAHALIDSDEKILFTLSLKGENIAVSGGIVKEKSVGPLALHFQNNGWFHIKDGSAAIEMGEIALLKNSSLSFNAHVDSVFKTEPKIDFHLGPVSLDLGELYSQAEPFIPAELSVALKGKKNSFFLEEADFSGIPPPGPLAVTLHNLKLSIDDLTFKNPNLAFTLKSRKNAGTTTFTLDSVNLSGSLPAGPEPLKARLNNLALNLANLEVSNKDLKLSLEGKKNSHSMSFTLDSVNLSGSLPAGPEPLKARLSNLALNLADLEVSNKDLKLSLDKGKKAHSMSFLLKDINFSGNVPFSPKPLKASLYNLALNLADLEVSKPDLELTLGNKKISAPTTFTLHRVDLSGVFPTGPNPLKVDRLVVGLPQLTLETGKKAKTGLELINLKKTINTIDVTLKDFFPQKASVSATLNLQKANVTGAAPVQVSNLKIEPLKITINNLTKNDKALFGVSSRISLTESLSVDKVTLSPLADIKGVKQSLYFNLNLAPRSLAELFIKDIGLSSSSIRLKVPGKVKTDLDLTASGGVKLTSLTPPALDIKNFSSSLSIGKFLKLIVQADAEKMAKEHVSAESKVTVNLKELMRVLPPQIRSKAKVKKLSGKIDLSLKVSGRLPREKEIKSFKSKKISDKVQSIDFLKNFDLSLELKNLNTEMSFPMKQKLRLSRFSTKKPFTFSLLGSQKGALNTTIKGQIDELPGLKPLTRPLTVLLDLSAANESIKAFKLSETLEIKPFNLKQNVKVTLTGLDRVLDSNLKNIAALLLKHVRGDVRSTVELGKGADLSMVKDNMELKGQFEGGAEIRLIPHEELNIRGWMDSPGMDIKLDSLAAIKNLQSYLVLEKNYVLVDRINIKTLKRKEKRSEALSNDVLNPLRVPLSMSDSSQKLVQRLLHDMKGRYRQRRSLSFDSARIAQKPLPLEVSNQVLDFRLEKGLPIVDYFQIDILGGTVTCSLSLKWKDGEFYLYLNTAFSGINAKKLAPQIIHDVSDREAELTGQMSLRLPLSVTMKSLLQSLELDLEITTIGSRTLERFLFALDPYEGNESIVNQRKLLRLGTPRWIKVFIKYGNFDMTGKLSVKGLPLDLPTIRRLNVGNLPGVDALESQLMSLESVIELLKYLVSDSIGVDRKGKVIFLYKGRQIQELKE